MADPIFVYSVAADTANGLVSPGTLEREIFNDAGLLVALKSILVASDVLTIEMKTTGTVKATLDAVVAAHTGVPLITPTTFLMDASLLDANGRIKYATTEDGGKVQTWDVADAAARDALVVGASDVGNSAKLATADVGSYLFLLNSVSPNVWLPLDGAGTPFDEKVKASATDTVSGRLIEKLLAGPGVKLKVTTPAVTVPFAQYLLNEEDNGQGASHAEDNQPTPFDIEHDYSTTPLQPEYINPSTGHGLEWITKEEAGGPHTLITGTKIETKLHGKTKASMCCVLDIDAVDATVSRFFTIGVGINAGLFTLEAANTTEIWFAYNDTLVKFAMNLIGGRQVVHVVYDSDQAVPEDRLRIYVDGARVARNSGTLPSLAETLDVDDVLAELFIGNRANNERSPDGRIHYCSLYDAAITQDQITMEASALAFNDDTDPTPSQTGEAVEIAAAHSKRYRRGFLSKSLSTSTLEVGIGSCRNNTDVLNLELTAAATVDITTSGAGGLDTGSEAANTWYAIHVIGDTTGANATKGMLSLSATAPTMPAGYNAFRHVAWARNDSGSNLKKFRYHTEQYCHYNTDRTDQTALSAGSATSFTAVDCSAFVPPTANLAEISISWEPNSGASSVQMRPGGQGSITDQINIRSAETSASSYDYPPFQAALDDVQELDYIVSSSGDDLWIYVHGFYDEIY